jgi:hypothetical protein
MGRFRALIANNNLFGKGHAAGCKGEVAAMCTMTTAQKGYALGVDVGTNVEFVDAIGGSQFCFTLGARVYSREPGRDAFASYAPRVCIS